MSGSSGGRSRKRGRRAITAIVALGLVGGLAAIGLMAMPSSGTSDKEATLELYEVSEISFDISVTASGELEAKNQQEIRSDVESEVTIEEIVAEGSQVEQGDVLVRLSPDAIEQRIDEELLKVESARSELIAAEQAFEIQVSENDAALRKAKLAVELAELELQKWTEGDLAKKLAQLEVNIEKAERQLILNKEKYDKSARLLEKGFVSKDDHEQDHIHYLESLANVKIAKLEKDVYERFERQKDYKKLTSDVEEAKAELERVERQNLSRIASKEADRTNKGRQLSIREDRLADLRAELEATTVRAPTDGLVVYGTTVERARNPWRNDSQLQVGQSVRPNQLLIALPDTSSMIASVRVHESYAQRIRPGMPVLLRVNAMQNKTFNGVVESIGVLAESGGWRDPNRREYTVRVAINEENSDRQLKPSMRCEAEIVLGSVEDALAVPVQAVFRDGPKAFVYSPKGRKYEKKPVELTRRRSTSYVEIASGVSSGDRVLLREPSPGEVLDTAGPGEETQVAGGEKNPKRVEGDSPAVRQVRSDAKKSASAAGR